MGKKLAIHTLSKRALGLAVAGFLVLEPAVKAAVATNPTPGLPGPRPVPKAPAKAPTNAPAARSVGTNVTGITKAASTNKVDAGSGFGAKVSEAIMGISKFPSSPAFVPVVAVLIVALIAILVLRRFRDKAKPTATETIVTFDSR